MELSNSPLLALKARGTIKASIESLLYIFRDVKGSLEWAPRLEKRKILKNISESEAIVYEVRKLPWPCQRRDLILHNKLHFDKSKKDGMLRKLLDSKKIKLLNWKHQIDLEEGLESTVNWYQEKFGKKR